MSQVNRPMHILRDLIPGYDHPAALRAATVALSALLALTALAMLPGGATAQDGGRTRLEGPEWQLLEYRAAADQTGLTTVPPGIAATALFFAGSLSGAAACSSYEASYPPPQAETITISAPEVTPRECDEEAQAIDEALYQGLADTAQWSIDGSILELRNVVNDPILRFTNADVPDDPTIAPWRVARLLRDGSIGPVTQGDPTVEFTQGGRVFGSTGCGWFLGSYTTNDTKLAISDLAFTPGSSCAPAIRDQAGDIVDALRGATDFDVLPAGLTLQDEEGVTRMALVPSIALSASTTWIPIDFPARGSNEAIPPERLVTSSVRFGGRSVDGRSICRGYGASSRQAGLALSVFDFQSSEGACRTKPNKSDAGLAPQTIDDALRAALESTASHALRGAELELMDSQGNAIMRLRPQPPFEGVDWVLTGINKKGTGQPLAGSRITASFDYFGRSQGDGLMTGELTFTGRPERRYDAEYSTPQATSIAIGDVNLVPSQCKPPRSPRCRQEATYLRLLQRADSYVVLEEELQLRRGERVRVLTFKPARLVDAAEE